ncbi:leukocyte elastase inhibitor C-like [Lucilia cuprina]|uniref:leukocyte elastase inhibitor C-like n=1 Tax=Lucilia cuprina TaxID=7375 RepID=UPI001F06E14E|nr:leukocyte elastase inhibitor C-like [Lucilia cuprina]
MKYKGQLQFLFLNLLLVLPMSAGGKLEGLEEFGRELFFTLSNYEPAENHIISPLPLATILILLRMDAEKKVAYEITEHLDLAGQPTDKLRESYLNLFEKMNQSQFFDMSINISFVYHEHISENLIMSVDTAIKSWSGYYVCIHSEELANIQTPSGTPVSDSPKVDIIIDTNVHFKNRLLYSITKTDEGVFYPLHGDKIAKTMLHHTAQIRYGEIYYLSATAVEVPYNDGHTYLVILIPNDRKGIVQLQDNLERYPLSNINQYLNNDTLKLIMPALKVEVRFPLYDMFEIMDMASMFTQMCDSMPDIKVTQFDYIASFEINNRTQDEDTYIPDDEEYLEEVPEIIVDHPFIFYIKSDEDDIYFMGKILE